MVGSVLMDRMQAEGDFAFIEPKFFSTSNAGGNAPAGLAKNEKKLHDAHDIAALKQCEIIVTARMSPLARTRLDSSYAVTRLTASTIQMSGALSAADLEVRPVGDELHVHGRDDAADLIRDLAAARGWALRRLVPRAPSLEETFLRLQAAATKEEGAAPAKAPTPEPAGRGS